MIRPAARPRAISAARAVIGFGMLVSSSAAVAFVPHTLFAPAGGAVPSSAWPGARHNHAAYLRTNTQSHGAGTFTHSPARLAPPP